MIIPSRTRLQGQAICSLAALIGIGTAVADEPPKDNVTPAIDIARIDWYARLTYAPIDVTGLCEDFRKLVIADRYAILLGANPVDPTIEFDMLEMGFVLGETAQRDFGVSSETMLDERFTSTLAPDDSFSSPTADLPNDFFDSDFHGLRGGFDSTPTDSISGPLAGEIDSLAYIDPIGR